MRGEEGLQDVGVVREQQPAAQHLVHQAAGAPAPTPAHGGGGGGGGALLPQVGCGAQRRGGGSDAWGRELVAD